MKELLKILFLLVTLPALVALRGYMLFKMWEWFVVPLSVPAIGIAQALGIAALLNALTGYGTKDPDPKKAWWEQTLTSLGTVTFTLALGWFLHYLMVMP